MFEQYVVAENFFLRDVQSVREASRWFLHDAGMTVPPRFDAAASIDLLQSVLAAEIVCVLRYTMISVSREGLKNEWIGTEFQAQANDERRHMVMVAKRIEALGGTPNFSPDGLASRAAGLVHCQGSFAARVQQNLAAERCVIEHYRELIAYFDQRDPESSRILQDILQDEEEHTSDMQDLLVSYVG